MHNFSQMKNGKLSATCAERNIIDIAETEEVLFICETSF
jgi:hypothetical protein